MKHIPLFVVLALLVTGCSVYHPQAVDIPLLQTAGETRADVAVGVSTSVIVIPDAVTINGTVSHAFTDWLAGQVHINGGSGLYYGQVAPGAYLPLGEKGVLEGYAGFGFGGSTNQTNSTSSEDGESSSTRTYSFHGTYSVPFVQGNIGWRNLGIFELAFGMKVGAYLPNYSYAEYDSTGAVRPESAVLYRDASLLLEPQLQARIGSENVKFTARLSYCWLSDMDREGVYYSGPANLIHDLFTVSLGMNFTF